MVIVFDLDDTLYPELSYVHSGFRAVADFLSPIIDQSSQVIFEALEKEESIKRAEVFDRFLTSRSFASTALIKQCVKVYRGHEPILSLFSEAEECLKRLHNHPIYIVTDGNHLVQRHKVQALGLEPMIKRCFYTYAHGLQYKKPSPYCFEKICKLENVTPESVVYIADNPYKDFVGLKPLGFQTIRVLTGAYRYVRMPPPFEAERKVQNLHEIDEEFLSSLLLFKSKG